jgi:hypothetical protein
MRKVYLVIVIILTAYCYASAQEVGVRVGNVSTGSVAVDAMFKTSKFSRIHGDFSVGNGVGIDVLWDFINKPLGPEAFNWYLGAGPYTVIDEPFWFGVAGEIGLEYRFRGVPLALGFDWRPALSIVEETDLHLEGFGFNLRFVFGKK